MSHILMPALTAGLVTYILTPAAGRFARAVGAIDRPGPARRIHDRPVPRMGGLAVFAGFGVGTALYADLSDAGVRAVLIGSAVLMLTGALDDRFSLSPGAKLFGQTVSAAVVMAGSVTIRALTVFGRTWPLPRALGIAVTMFWLVGMANALNLLDGMDALAAGVAAESCAFTLLVSALLPVRTRSAPLIAALGGACLGFLPHNRHPAKIFLGDTGSLLLGFVPAAAAISGLVKSYTAVAFALPLVIWALPIADTALAFLRRMKNGVSPFRADRRHIHHRLLDAGYSQQEAVSLLWCANAAAGFAAVFLSAPDALRPAAGGLFCGAAALLWRTAYRRRRGG